MKRLKGLSAIIAIAAALLFAACHDINNASIEEHAILESQSAASSGTSATESTGAAEETTETPAAEESADVTATESAAPTDAESAGTTTETGGSADTADSAVTTPETEAEPEAEPETESTPKVKTESEVKAETPVVTRLVGISEAERENAEEENKACSHAGLMLKNNTPNNIVNVCLGCILSGDWKKAGFTSLYIDLKGETLDLTGVPPTDPDKLPGPKESTVTAGTAKSGVTLKNGILLVGKSDKWTELLEAINLDNVLWIKETR